MDNISNKEIQIQNLEKRETRLESHSLLPQEKQILFSLHSMCFLDKYLESGLHCLNEVLYRIKGRRNLLL